ncbi:MAG: hypothetical protein Q4A25_01780 [Candidatus Saccharibacteria bacterium]|nr:hypothetical protein [Candidatus Saccharibacteria bacterium]
MAKKINSKKVKRSIKSGLDFSKFYFSKSTSVVLITSYSIILLLALSVLGFSNLISAPSPDNGIPSLPEKEPFAFLPADNLEVPTLGEVDATKDEPKEPETPEKPEETTPESIAEEPAPTEIATPAAAETPMISTPVRIVEKEVPKEVVKVVEKEVVKEVVKEVPKETPAKNEPEQTYYDNYTAPEITPIGDFPEYKNFPDEIEEVSKENEINSEQ